ncbi:PIN domain-containing protein [Massilia mucilaginosa]|uniref:PIN domain-containing protein n=1 Tax=Massilia mucilaginosa TaxID=2609282 RepID=UPI001CB6C32F|nr:PIN domain-containing protein [Massilia mucilaginosa]
MFDTNIVIDALNGTAQASQELEYYANPAISTVTWMELIAGASLSEQPRARAFLIKLGFEVIQTNEAIMHEAAALRSAAQVCSGRRKFHCWTRSSRPAQL